MRLKEKRLRRLPLREWVLLYSFVVVLFSGICLRTMELVCPNELRAADRFEMAKEPAPAVDAPKRFVVPAECIHAEQGHCFIASMDFGEPGDKSTGNRSKLKLFEDGKLLGPPRSVHAPIREKGNGRYSHWTRETLYLSASDNTDPRTNGRTYEVASHNPNSTLGGLSRFPTTERQHVEEIKNQQHEYTIHVGGALDMENTRTLSSSNCTVAFQNNIALSIENTGDSPVVNPRLVINDRGNWYTFDSLLEEFTHGARTDQERVFLIWENMRQNLYHQMPLFGDSEPHDPVRLLNSFGFNLCDDAGNAGCSLFYHAGLMGSKNRALNGHVQCEAMVNGSLQFMDVDMDCFYLDRENEHPVSGDVCARDHDLVRRELNYGPVVDRFTPSDNPAALFGSDDRLHDARLRGHAIVYTLRPGEQAVFRWDQIGKYCAENSDLARAPRYFGNSKFLFRPRLSEKAVHRDAVASQDVAWFAEADDGDKVIAMSPDSHVVYDVNTPYPVCGGRVRASFASKSDDARFSVALSLDGKTWNELWTARGPGNHDADVVLDPALDVHRSPGKYRFQIRVGFGVDRFGDTTSLNSLELETDILAAPIAIPRLVVGTNQVVYHDATEADHHVRITHRWRELDAVCPPPRIDKPEYPPNGARVSDSYVAFSWPTLEGVDRYHVRVSRRPDFRYPYRPCLDVIIPATEWKVPYTGLFSPDTEYYWRVRCRNRWGVWGDWSEGWRFTWKGPRVPVDVHFQQEDQTITLHWKPNPRGEQPAKYEVYGSDEKGFSIHKESHAVPGRGQVDGNFLGETCGTSMVVAGPETANENANRVFYRIVAIDDSGTASGCSDYVEFPHPFVTTAPVVTAVVGRRYAYAVASLRSLGDYQCRQNPSVAITEYAYRFWDVEEISLSLIDGPAWLSVDSAKGVLTGTPTPDDVGVAKVRLLVRNQFGDRAQQEFHLSVSQ